MRIKSLKVSKYKNLINFDCKFPDTNIIAFIGNNGSGKSNILEFIASLFAEAKNLAEYSFPYSYDLEYEIDSSKCQLISSDVFNAFKNGKPDIKKLDSFLPKVIFTYYAGETPRMKNIAAQCIDKKYDLQLKKNSDIDFKFLTYLSLGDLDISFLTNFLFETEIFKVISKMLGISGVRNQPILLCFKKPSWASKKGSIENFWGATGFVKEFLDKLLQKDESYGSAACEFISQSDNEEGFFLGINSCELFKNIFVTPLDMFIKLKALKEADILRFIIIETMKGDVAVHLSNYSEGEKQLANLLFILDLTKEYKALFLLDEIDAYLHPNWQRHFVNMISQIKIRGQLFFTTHSPASISKLKKESVYIMNNGNAFAPLSETYNRSLDEIMQENMGISLRTEEYEKLVLAFRMAIIHGKKQLANEILEKIKCIVSEEDPFLVTARLALNRME